MEHEGQFNAPKFTSPEEELQYLRERVRTQEAELKQEGAPPPRQETIISNEIIAYSHENPKERLEEHLILEDPKFEESVNLLSSLSHREKMREVYRILLEKGILNALKVVRELQSPHMEDDFHGVLVHYIKTGALVPGLEKEPDLNNTLRKTVYEITMPHAAGETMPTLTQSLESMERFFAGLLPADREHVKEDSGFTLELAMSNFTSDIVFYIAIKDEHREKFKQQLFGSFPQAKIEEVVRDYNIFNLEGVTLASTATNLTNFAFPIADMSKAEGDPLRVLLSSFSKISRDGEGASLQLVVTPDRDAISGKIKFAIGKIREGTPIKAALNIPLSFSGDIMKTVSGLFKSPPPKIDPAKADNHTLEFRDKALEMLEEKLMAPFVKVNMRIVASAGTRDRANEILSSIESAFNQYTRPQGNGLRFVRKEKGELTALLRNFTFRDRDDDFLVLNTRELATIYHFPTTIARAEAPQLKTVQAANAPAPVDLPTEGTLLGINKYRGEKHEIRMTKADRLRHLYVIGQTGTGKTTLLKNMIVDDIKAGHGVCFIDPHGSDVQDILANIPKERVEDVIYFDPSYTPRPFGLNMLEYDLNKPEQKIFVVNELFSIFKKLYASSPESMGPAFEQYFRNATMLVMEDPETGNTLLEIPRVLADASFRNLKLSRCKNPIVVQFWRDIATKTSGESGLANMIPYITNKFDVFLANDIMRPIIAQEKSSFDFRDVMDNKKILLVNLAKGRLGDINANLIGLVLVGKILMAALSRVDAYGKTLPDFYLYIDEFQNISTDSISSILSEARKYGLSLNVAHQFIAQLDPVIKDAVFGNVGSMAVFRVGTEDAQFLESQFAPTFTAADIMKIDNRNAYLKMLINGKPIPPFNIETLPPPSGNPEIVEQLKNLSYLRFGKDRKIVDESIMGKYLHPAPPAAPLHPASPATPAALAPVSATIPAVLPPQAPPMSRADIQVPAQAAPPPLTPTNQFRTAFAGLPPVSSPISPPVSSQVVVPPPPPVAVDTPLSSAPPVPVSPPAAAPDPYREATS